MQLYKYKKNTCQHFFIVIFDYILEGRIFIGVIKYFLFEPLLKIISLVNELYLYQIDLKKAFVKYFFINSLGAFPQNQSSLSNTTPSLYFLNNCFLRTTHELIK
jgi:hypothetical protein